MFRWLSERRQRKQQEAAERRAQLREKLQPGGIAGARKQLSYYSEGAAEQRRREAENMGQSFVMQQLAQELADSRSGDHHRPHVTQVHHGSGDNVASSASHSHHGHSSHDYSSSYHSSHDSGSSYDSGSSSSGSDSSW